MKKSDVETEAIDLYKVLGDDIHYGLEEQPAEPQQQDHQLPTRYEADAYYNTVHSSAPRQIDCFTIVLSKRTGTTFPQDIKNIMFMLFMIQVQVAVLSTTPCMRHLE